MLLPCCMLPGSAAAGHAGSCCSNILCILTPGFARAACLACCAGRGWPRAVCPVVLAVQVLQLCSPRSREQALSPAVQTHAGGRLPCRRTHDAWMALQPRELSMAQARLAACLLAAHLRIACRAPGSSSSSGADASVVLCCAPASCAGNCSTSDTSDLLTFVIPDQLTDLVTHLR